MQFFRPILLVNGFLLVTIGLAMVLPAMLDLAADHPASGADWKNFLRAAGVTVFAGLGLILANWGYDGALSPRQAFALTTTTWVFIATFASLPFLFADLHISFTDAFFESMSGLTTTGSTVLTGLDAMPPGLLIWRAILQWLGGIGIIVMAIAVLPMLQVGGMQLFRMESSDTSQKILPRATQIAGSIFAIYLGLSILCVLAYIAVGMAPFHALAHGMTTIATGGYSTSDASIGRFDSPGVEAVAITFMLIGSLPFVLYLQAVRGRASPLLKDGQVRWFLITVVTLVLIHTVYRSLYVEADHPLEALRHATFNVTSIVTGTGYVTEDYTQWGAFTTISFFCIMFIGGCAGSTTCGIKIFRFQVIFAAMSVQIRRTIHPHGVFLPRYNGQKIGQDVVSAVASYIFLFFMSFAVLAFALSLLGLDMITAFSSAGTAIANVGPGLGERVGPASTFQSLPDAAKWLMSFGMLLGRLEVLTVLIMLTPSYWRI